MPPVMMANEPDGPTGKEQPLSELKLFWVGKLNRTRFFSATLVTNFGFKSKRAPLRDMVLFCGCQKHPLSTGSKAAAVMAFASSVPFFTSP